jgi:hypothetical protein
MANFTAPLERAEQIVRQRRKEGEQAFDEFKVKNGISVGEKIKL